MEHTGCTVLSLPMAEPAGWSGCLSDSCTLSFVDRCLGRCQGGVAPLVSSVLEDQFGLGGIILPNMRQLHQFFFSFFFFSFIFYVYIEPYGL